MKVLGYDCDGNELEEFDIVRPIWFAETDFDVATDVNPRQYCVVVGEDGKTYLMSVLDHWYKQQINRFEGRNEFDKVPIKILPIEKSSEFEVGYDSDENRFTYPFDRNKLIETLNSELKNSRLMTSKDNFKRDAKLFMVFDILGDTERSGPHMWHVDRFRLEDVKNHVFDLMLIARLLKKYLPDTLDYNKMFDYILCHDLPEVITGDITKFEGVSEEERKRVTDIAISYLANVFGDSLDIDGILDDYENRVDLEAKVVNMIDKVHSATTFMKYECESHINVDDPRIIPELRNMGFVADRIKDGKDVADIFYEFHMRSINISDDECLKYGISRDFGDYVVSVVRGFFDAMYDEKNNGTLCDVRDSFPKEAMVYKKEYTKKDK